MLHDRSNPLLIKKFETISSCLKPNKEFLTAFFYRPTNVENLIPTSMLACFLVNYDKDNFLHDAVKKAVYKPSKDRITDKDMFRINKHGIYFRNKTNR